MQTGLLEGMANGFTAMDEIEASLVAPERPGEPQNGADGAKIDEIQLSQVNPHGFAAGVKPLLDGRGQVGAIGRFHPPLGPRDEALPLV